MLIPRNPRSEDGQSLVEAALCITVLMSLVLGIMQLGMALYTFNFVSDAAREGSRYAMVHGSSCAGCIAATSNVQTVVQSMGLMGINPSDLTVTTTWPDTGFSCTPSATPCNNPGNNVKVTVSYLFHLNIPFIASRLLNLQSTSETVISR